MLHHGDSYSTVWGGFPAWRSRRIRRRNSPRPAPAWYTTGHGLPPSPLHGGAPPAGARRHLPLRLAHRGRRRVGRVVAAPALGRRGGGSRTPGGAGGGAGATGSG